MIRKITHKKKLLKFLLTSLALCAGIFEGRSQTVLINPAGDGGFETGSTFAANGWTVVNNASATMNNWVLSTGASGYSGARAAYISNNSAGTPPAHTYDNTTPSAVHLYKDVTFPAGETNISFSFSSKQTGEVDWDRCLVFISNGTPTGAPLAGDPASTTGLPPTISGYTYLYTVPTSTSFTTQNVTITAAQAGNASAASTRRILFVWHNDDNTGTNPPAAIDNVSLTTSCITPVSGLTVLSIGTATATVGWNAVSGATSYNVRYKKLTDPATVSTWTTPVSSPTNSVALSGLTSSTVYEFQVSAVGTGVCNMYTASATFSTACSGPSITASTPGTRCGIGTVSLQATGSAGSTLKWYDAPVNGTQLGTGSPFTTPVISSTTPFYVAPASVGATVNSTLGAGALTTSGSGGSGGNYVSPFSHYYGGYKAQYVIRASELTAAGVVAGNITSLGFDVTSTGTSYAGFAISMGTTTNTTASTTFVTAGLTPVYSGTPTPAVGINTYTFSAPFQWDGTSNIIVNLCWSNNNGGGSACEVKYDATSFVAMAYYRADSQTPAAICGTTTATNTLSNRPKMIFGNAPVCEGARVAVNANVTTAPAITASSPQAPGVCTGGTATINVTSANTNYGYSWSTGQTTASFTVTPASSTRYVVTATDPGTGCVARDSVLINVSTVPPVPVVTPATATICQGSSVLLTGVAGGSGTLTFGTGTSVNSTTGYPAPYSNYYGGTKHQMMIRASELIAAGLTAGSQITSVAFRVSAVGSTFTGTLQNFQINMGGTTATTLTTANFVAVPSVVYGPVSTPIPTTGLPATVTHTLTTPFTWNGTDNLVIQTSYSNGNSGTTNDNVQMLNTDPGFSSTNWYRADGSTASAILTSTTVNGAGNARPNMIIGYSSKAPISWTPATGLYRNAALTIPVTALDTAASVYASPAANTVYTARGNNSGCYSASSNTATITVNPSPSTAITNTGSLSFCDGGSVVLNAPTGTGLTYVWNRNGTPITPAATGATYTASVAGAYTVTVTNATPCSATTPTPVNVVVNAAPPANITASGSTIFCTGGSVVLTAPAPPAGTTYTYVWKNNNTAIPGQTGISTTVSTSSNITVTVTNTTTNCSSTTPTAVVVTSGAPPAAPISGATSTTICQGQSVRLRTNSVAGLSYQWKLGGVDIPGAIDSVYNATAAGTYTVQVSITGATNCFTVSSPLTVTVNPLPPASITASGAPTTFCQGGSVVLTGNTGTNLTYQWQVGASPVVPANTTSTHTATASGSYTLIVTNSATQCFSTSNAIAVTVNPLPTATITAAGSTSICQGNSVVLNANTGTGLTYQWFNGAGPIAGATNASYTTNAGGDYTVRVTNTNSCAATSAITTVTVNPLPPTTVTPNGTVNVCSGSTVTLNGPTSPTGMTYQWKSGSTNASGTSTAASYTTGTAGVYRLVVTTAAGCRDSSAAVTVAVLPLPAVAMTPSAATSGCDSVVLATANTGVTYQWNYNNAPIIGATGNRYAATVSGNYSLTNTSTTNGCSATSANTAITINQSPVGEITYSSPLIFCQGGAIVLNTYTAPNQTYEWRNNNVVIPGATTPTYITTQSGLYTVKVVNTVTNCTRISRPVLVGVNPLPTPTITFDAVAGVLRTTQPYQLYQWYRNNQPITGPGANFSTYRPMENGGYTVSVTDSNGCVNLAPIYFINNVGIVNTAAGKAIRIYPNPTSGVLQVQSAVPVQLSLRDVTGKTVLSGTDKEALNLETLADGIYLLYIRDAAGQLIRVEKINKRVD